MECISRRKFSSGADFIEIRQSAISAASYMDTKQYSDSSAATDYSNAIPTPTAAQVASFANHVSRRAEFSNAPVASSYFNAPSLPNTIPSNEYNLNNNIISTQAATDNDVEFPPPSVSTASLKEDDNVSMHNDKVSSAFSHLMQDHIRYFSVPEDRF